MIRSKASRRTTGSMRGAVMTVLSNSKLRHKVAAIALTTAAATGAGVAAAQPAAAANMYSGALIYSAPSPYAYVQGGTLINGTPFTMRCWIDGAWANGTNRWFYGNGIAYNHRTGRFNMMYGYVSAAKVYNQDSVGRC